ncbi:EamA/RhaT family transporter [Myroides sp. JBRI-B21084]|uniref:EamA family transporter n=1 Tax=Myroides sp. JBRI-B21084 TaxID=3119977 RepID=UPI0026E372E6|nr:EamA family transporter [Paenimyroides cloacae]WKW45698.1 EamA/RhaT family transporter [Paenimyroides cloacae]
MHTLIISLVCSLIVGFYIKWLKINNLKDFCIFILSNYVIAVSLSFYFFNDKITFNTLKNSFSIQVLALGFLLPTIFLLLNKSLKKSGLAKTDIFQRLSLIIPVVLSFYLFNEIFTFPKLIAIMLAFISIVLLLYKKSTNHGNSNIFYLLSVFIGYGVVDTLFKILATNKNIPYVVALFLIFGISAIVCFLFLFFVKGKIKSKTIFQGFILGALNFCNIFFYLKAHKIFIETPTLVFITMNLGVIIGGTIIGTTYFKEKISNSALIGIFTAILSVLLLALIQLKLL